MKIKAINISTQFKLENHNVNANEDTSPKNVNGKTAISGQKIRFMLMETIKNESGDINSVSTSDGVTCNIATDLRSDLIGYMNTSDGSYATRRTSPLQVAYAVATTESNYFEDLFVRFKTNPTQTEHNKQRINNKTYSVSDIININYKLDCSMLSTTEYFKFDNIFVNRFFVKHVEETERMRRAELFIKGTSYLTGLANQSRNAVVNTPQKVFICFDEKSTFKKFFDMGDKEQKDLLASLDSKNIKYIIGGIGYEMGVEEAYSKAYEYLSVNELVDLSQEVLTQEEVASKYGALLEDLETKAKAKKSKSKKEEEKEEETE